MEQNVLIAIFDDLRYGCRKNNFLPSTSIYIGTFISEPIFDLFKVKEKTEYTLLQNGSYSITFDIYSIDSLLYTNILSNYNAANFSKIKINKPLKIITPFGEAITFVRNVSEAPKLGIHNIIKQIESGDILNELKNEKINTN